MKSPFPGMDPYLERWWHDVHHKICTYACDALQAQLGQGLRARIDERLVVEADEDGRSIYPDLSVIETGAKGLPARPAAGSAIADSLIVHIESEPVRQAFINIIDVRNGNRLITCVEFLSPSNKLPGDGRDQYLRKQREVRQSGASLVEIDLVRTGRRPTLAQPKLGPQCDSTYQACILRAWQATQCEVIRIPLGSPLPAVPIPLRQTDPEATLDLQSLIEQVYRNGVYGDELDYSRACTPPLQDDEATWAAALLQEAGKRRATTDDTRI